LTYSDFKAAVFNKRMLICVFTGFSSGLPFFVVYQLLQVWLRDNDVSRADIGLFALVGVPYTLKFLWSPLMDRYIPPLLGRRRGWMLVTQLACLLMIGSLGLFNPKESLMIIAYMVLILSFFSASQDIVLDAYRREILPDNELGLGNSIHVQAWRIAGLIPGSLALILADSMPWSTVYIIVAMFMLVGLSLCLWADEPELVEGAPKTIKAAVIEPFVEFFSRRGVKHALLILSFMFLYKVGDSMATALSSVFYLDLGFTKSQIGIVAKNAALWPSIIGGLLGGLLMVRIGINKALWIFGVVQVVSIIGFVLLAQIGANIWMLAAVIGFEYLGVGLGTAAFVAFIARETDKRYAATQFALLTALTALPRTFANASVGFVVDTIGWTSFFLFCTAVAIPGMLLLLKVAPWGEQAEAK